MLKCSIWIRQNCLRIVLHSVLILLNKMLFFNRQKVIIFPVKQFLLIFYEENVLGNKYLGKLFHGVFREIPSLQRKRKTLFEQKRFLHEYQLYCKLCSTCALCFVIHKYEHHLKSSYIRFFLNMCAIDTQISLLLYTFENPQIN